MGQAEKALSGISRSIRLPVLFVLALVLSLGALWGVQDARGTPSQACGIVLNPNPSIRFIAAFTNDDGVANPSFDPGDNGNDPGMTMNVAACTATIDASGNAVVNVTNAYPTYSCTFWVTMQNDGSVPLRQLAPTISSPGEISVTEVNPQAPGVIQPGATETEGFTLRVSQQAVQNARYPFTISKTFDEDTTGSAGTPAEGSMGFWKNWDKHKKYTKASIETWLAQIDAASRWLGPRTVSGMVSTIEAAGKGSATPKSRFLAQYLATRLDERSGILAAGGLHNLTGIDPANYLGLGAPSHATLSQILSAIESKYGTSPKDAQYNTLKDVCEKLNTGGV